MGILDTCKSCGEVIYPDDEKVLIEMDLYHFECAEEQDLPDED